MLRKNFLATLLLPLLVACDNVTDVSPLVGSWISESCEQLTGADSNPIDAWARSVYSFSAERDIRVNMRAYADSNCQTLIDDAYSGDLDFSIRYEDLGAEILQEGLDGRGLRVTFEVSPLPLSAKGFYVIDNVDVSKVCFSYAFRFDATSFGISLANADAIDFSNCLLRFPG